MFPFLSGCSEAWLQAEGLLLLALWEEGGQG